MPNGEGHDPRALWEIVRDLEQDYAALIKAHDRLRHERDMLRKENQGLLSKLGRLAAKKL